MRLTLKIAVYATEGSETKRRHWGFGFSEAGFGIPLKKI
jgi:hypothetical protein